MRYKTNSPPTVSVLPSAENAKPPIECTPWNRLPLTVVSFRPAQPLVSTPTPVIVNVAVPPFQV